MVVRANFPPCRWDDILPKHVRAHHRIRTHAAFRSEHHTSQQNVPTQSLQAWIPTLSPLLLCERGWLTGLNGNPRSQCACASGGAWVRVRGPFGNWHYLPANLHHWTSGNDDHINKLKKVRSFSVICLLAKPNICAEVPADFVVLFPTGLNRLSQSRFFKITAPVFFIYTNKCQVSNVLCLWKKQNKTVRDDRSRKHAWMLRVTMRSCCPVDNCVEWWPSWMTEPRVVHIQVTVDCQEQAIWCTCEH